MPLSILLLHCSEIAAIKDTVHRVQPGATIDVFDAPTDAGAVGGHFDVIIVHAADNAGSARVRQARHWYPNACIIATAERDRSANAYMSGANEFIMSYDTDRLAHILGELVGAAPSAPPAMQTSERST